MAEDTADDRHPDNPPPSGPFTHWIDTNVFLEVYSHGDLFAEGAAHKRGEVPASSVEERRVRMQGSLWMAMALCRAQAITKTYSHENLRNILRLAPPGSPAGAWTATVLYLLGDHGVFDGWERHVDSIGETLSNRDRDRLIVTECKRDKLILVSRDEQLIGEARAQGVDADEPEPFAARHCTREDARTMFHDRLRDAATSYLVKGPSWEHETRTRVGQTAREAYAVIWQPVETPVFT